MLEDLYHMLQWTWGGFPIRSGQAGYNICSGPLADASLLGVFYMLWRKGICRVPRCFRKQWGMHVLCRKHVHDPPDGFDDSVRDV